MEAEALDRPAWNPARQCTGTNRAGERCQRQPIPGGAVCVMHGGSIPAVQATAKLRLLAMVEPILATFEEILASWHRVTCTGCGHVDENGVKCVGCGKPTGDPAPVIRIGQLVLDRSGFHPSLTIQAAPPVDNLAHLSLAELADRAERIAQIARESANAEAARMLPIATDGVLLDDAFIVPEDDEPEQAPACDTPPIQEPDVQIPTGNDTPEDSIMAKSLEQKDFGDV